MYSTIQLLLYVDVTGMIYR